MLENLVANVSLGTSVINTSKVQCTPLKREQLENGKECCLLDIVMAIAVSLRLEI